MAKTHVVVQSGSLGLLWFAGWLFTLGFLSLSFWHGLFAIVVWPYYLGAHLAGLT